MYMALKKINEWNLADVFSKKRIEQSSTEGLGVLSFENIVEYLNIYWNTDRAFRVDQKPMFLWGEPGEGKTQAIYTFAERKCSELGKEFCNVPKLPWHDEDALTKKVKDIVEHPDKYFLFIDVRLAGELPETIKGIPNMDSLPWTTFKVPLVFRLILTPGISGVIFFDEFNQAKSDVQKILYQLNERQIDSKTISENILVIAAGNLTEPLEYEALKARFTNFRVILTVEDWVKWGSQVNPKTGKQNIHSDILEFIQSDPSFFRMPAAKSGESKPSAGSNPRSISKFSSQYTPLIVKLEANEIEPDFFHKYIATHSKDLGEQWSEAFLSFLEGKYEPKLNKFNFCEDSKKVAAFVDSLISKAGKSSGTYIAIKSEINKKVEELGKQALDELSGADAIKINAPTAFTPGAARSPLIRRSSKLTTLSETKTIQCIVDLILAFLVVDEEISVNILLHYCNEIKRKITDAASANLKGYDADIFAIILEKVRKSITTVDQAKTFRSVIGCVDSLLKT